MRFSRKYKTYKEWLEHFRGTKTYKQRIISLHRLYPDATLSQLRGHPKQRESALSKLRLKIKYKRGISTKNKKDTMRFSRKYKTYKAWLEYFKGTEAYKKRIISLHRLYPNATLSQLRGHPKRKERLLSKLRPRIRYERGISTKIKKELLKVDNAVIRMMYQFGMSPYQIYITIRQFPCMNGISLKYIKRYLRGKKKIYNTIGHMHERIKVMYEFIGEGYLTRSQAHDQVKRLYVNYLKSALITVLDKYGKSEKTTVSLLRAFRRRYGCILIFDNEYYSFFIHEE